VHATYLSFLTRSEAVLRRAEVDARFTSLLGSIVSAFRGHYTKRQKSYANSAWRGPLCFLYRAQLGSKAFTN